MSLPNGKNDLNMQTIRRPDLLPLCKGMVSVPTTTSRVRDGFSKSKGSQKVQSTPSEICRKAGQKGLTEELGLDGENSIQSGSIIQYDLTDNPTGAAVLTAIIESLRYIELKGSAVNVTGL